MNVITICQISDLRTVIHEPLHLSGVIEDETVQNMWCIAIADDCVTQITTCELICFFDDLIQQKEMDMQLSSMHSATLYIWCDTQALQLRFNIISGVIVELPFHCEVNIVSSLQCIIDEFVKAVYAAAQYDVIETLSSDSYELDGQAGQNYVLNVYKRILMPCELD